MKPLKLAAIVALCAASTPIVSPTAYAQVQQLDAEINIIPDKTKNTDKIILGPVGIPHTSQRIDSIDLIVGKQKIAATDIDGVDFERYFQFEDDGVQVIEVDFPFKGQLPKTAELIFHTVKGDILAPARQ